MIDIDAQRDIFDSEQIVPQLLEEPGTVHYDGGKILAAFVKIYNVLDEIKAEQKK